MVSEHTCSEYLIFFVSKLRKSKEHYPVTKENDVTMTYRRLNVIGTWEQSCGFQYILRSVHLKHESQIKNQLDKSKKVSRGPHNEDR